MTKTKTERVTRRSVLASFLALAVCMSMLIGTSYAWFTDSVTSAGNIIKSGKLDVEMYWADGKGPVDTTADWQDASQGAMFKDHVLWEPGYVDVRHINIKNVGNLALKYEIAIIANGELTKNDNGHTLADAIDVYYLENARTITKRTELTEDMKVGSLSTVLADLSTIISKTRGVLYPSQNTPQGGVSQDTVTIALKMRESAGNEYQNMTLGTDFSVQLLATQYTYETDSFNDQYDAKADETPDNAEWPYEVVGAAVVTDATQDLNVTADNITVTVPKAALKAGDKFEVLVDNRQEAKDGNTTTVNFDLKLRRNGVLVTEQDGIEYTVAMQLDKELEIDSLTHNGETITAYTYDSTTGVLTFKATHFSPFVLVYHKATQEIEPATSDALKELLDEYNESDEVRPIAIKLSDSFTYEETPLKVDSGKNVTIDLNGHDLTIGNDASDGLVVEGGGTLTLTNSGNDGAYTFNTNSRSNDGIYVYNENADETTTLNFEDVEINIDASQWISIHACAKEGQAIININDGTVINVTGSTDQIAGVYADGGSVVNMNGGVINVQVIGDNTNDATGILVGNGMNVNSTEGATLNMNGGIINVVGGGTFASGIETGAIYGGRNNKVNMTGGTINVSGQDACAFAIAGWAGYADVKVSGGNINMKVDVPYSGFAFVFEYPSETYGVVQVKKGVVNLQGNNNKLTDTPARVNEYE